VKRRGRHYARVRIADANHQQAARDGGGATEQGLQYAHVRGDPHARVPAAAQRGQRAALSRRTGSRCRLGGDALLLLRRGLASAARVVRWRHAHVAHVISAALALVVAPSNPQPRIHGTGAWYPYLSRDEAKADRRILSLGDALFITVRNAWDDLEPIQRCCDRGTVEPDHLHVATSANRSSNRPTFCEDGDTEILSRR